MKVSVDVVRRNATLRPTGRSSEKRTVLFHNKRELWQAKRAAERLNMTLSAYIRALTIDHSAQVLGER